RRQRLVFDATTVPVPTFVGTRNASVPLAELVPWIDWSPFFHTWELSGRYPAILDDRKKGEAARKVFADAQALLRRIVAEQLLTARGAYGLFPAGSTDDDQIIVFDPTDRAREIARFAMPRQREDKDVCYCLADFIAPLAGASPPRDHLGGFIVTAGIGTDELAGRFERDHDDYSAIMAKALADRLAEAFAEYLHHQARVDWGYGAGEALSHDQILAEKYRGIRPAFGYPACPEHAPKATLFALLDHADHHGVSLTESYAMYPTASVSGLYFAHPAATYFSVGRQR
ncbi:MAG TPA: vitamin B12 dependent-methionine synthase activation domain-containing protein, partial [Kofleriaceae bacterium]|nr:vitamin B12 dependent-methionine synthase activation domain-containing protein [Kofleriaceae bacterium]